MSPFKPPCHSPLAHHSPTHLLSMALSAVSAWSCVVPGNWYWLMLTLAASLGMTSYADGRSNRSIAATACILSTLSTLQFLSFWVYSARRINATASAFDPLTISDNQHSQFAEIGGAGLIMLCQCIISFILLARYFTYLPITAEHARQFHHPAHLNGPTEINVVRDTSVDPNTVHSGVSTGFPNSSVMYVPGVQREKGGLEDVPSYNLHALHGVGLVLRALICFEVLLVFAWWVIQVVSTAESSVFSNPREAEAYFFNERNFILTTVLCTISFLAAVWAERHRDVGTARAACAVCSCMFAGFWLLVWPFAFQSVASDGYLRAAACDDGGTWCGLTRASAVLALMQGFMLLFVLISAAFTVTRMPRLDELASGRRLPVLLTGGLVWILQLLLWIWAGTTIAATVRDDQIGFLEQWQTVESPNGGFSINTSDVGAGGAAFTEGYWASQAFLLLLLITAVSWLLCWSRTPFQWQNRATRILTCGACIALAASTLPMLIFACRFAQTLSLNSDERTYIAAFILLPLTAIAILTLALYRFMEPLYRHVPTIARTQDTAHQSLVTERGVMQGAGEPLDPQKVVWVGKVAPSMHTEETITVAHD